jgi:hypothetical protein
MGTSYYFGHPPRVRIKFYPTNAFLKARLPSIIRAEVCQLLVNHASTYAFNVSDPLNCYTSELLCATLSRYKVTKMSVLLLSLRPLAYTFHTFEYFVNSLGELPPNG